MLSLIPAKEYYAKDNSDQWQAKKQTKEQKRLARKAKLDPANQKTAKDVMDENERKRKRELEGEDSADVGQASETAQGDRPVSSNSPGAAKRQKVEADPKTEAEKRQAKADKRRQKREKKLEKVDKKRQKTEAKKTKQDDDDLTDALHKRQQEDAHDHDDHDQSDAPDQDSDAEIMDLDIDGLLETKASTTSEQSSTPASNLDSPLFEIPSGRQSASSSSASSIVPPSLPEPSTNSSKTKSNPHPPTQKPAPTATSEPTQKLSQEALQARLKARIDALRSARKANGTDNTGPKSRQDLLDARRKKSDARKQHKKELRLKAREEEQRLNNERLRGSGSPLTNADIFAASPMLSPALTKAAENNFSFGRVSFGDGVEADAALQGLIGTNGDKKRGPKDTKHALEAVEKKAARMASFDASKRQDIESKDAWLNAKKRAHGERVRDDASLLKKTLKRKEGEKLKSGREWGERKDGVQRGIDARQKKREANLAARKDGKGKGGGKGKKTGGGGGAKKGAAGAGNKKKKGRPGFEGR